MTMTDVASPAARVERIACSPLIQGMLISVTTRSKGPAVANCSMRSAPLDARTTSASIGVKASKRHRVAGDRRPRRGHAHGAASTPSYFGSTGRSISAGVPVSIQESFARLMGSHRALRRLARHNVSETGWRDTGSPTAAADGDHLDDDCRSRDFRGRATDAPTKLPAAAAPLNKRNFKRDAGIERSPEDSIDVQEFRATRGIGILQFSWPWIRAVRCLRRASRETAGRVVSSGSLPARARGEDVLQFVEADLDCGPGEAIEVCLGTDEVEGPVNVCMLVFLG